MSGSVRHSRRWRVKSGALPRLICAAGCALLAAMPNVGQAQEVRPGALPVANPGDAALQLETHSTLTVDKGTIGVADRGDVIAYVFAVTNSGSVAVGDIAIDDRHGGSGRLSPIGSETLINDAPPFNDSSDATANDGRWSTLAPGDTVIFAATYAVTQGDIDGQ